MRPRGRLSPALSVALKKTAAAEKPLGGLRGAQEPGDVFTMFQKWQKGGTFQRQTASQWNQLEHQEPRILERGGYLTGGLVTD